MANIRDIIQRIILEGDQAINASLKRTGDIGTAAFGAIGAAAEKVATPFTKFEADIKKVEASAKSFGGSIVQLGNSLSKMTSRIGVIGGGFAAAGAAMVKSTLGISTALRTIREDMISQKLAASQNAADTKKLVQTDFAHANALEDLDRAYRSGAMSAKEYNDQLKQTQFEQDRARKQALALSAEQESIQREQARATAALQQRQVLIKLEASSNAQLAGVLVNLAGVLERVRQKFFETFGPQIAQFLTNVVAAIERAAPAIFKAFESIATNIQKAFANSKISIDGVIAGMIKFAQDAANTMINVVIPAFQAFLAILDVIAQGINAVFGTNLTAGGLIAGAIILKLVGLFGVFTSAIGLAAKGVYLLWASFGPLGIAIGIIVAILATVLIPLIQSIDWTKVGETAIAAWEKVKSAVNDALNAIKDTWDSVTKFITDKIDSLINWFDRLIKKAKEFLGISSDGGSLGADAGVGDIGKFARGGLFRGRPGIDQNLAMVSDWEYMIKPRATRFWGTDFLNAINNMRNPFRGFNGGGLVAPLMQTAPIARFDRGGLNRTSPGRPFVLQMKDGTEFSGMTIQEETADNMGRYAAKKNIRSGGRKPLWYGGGR